MGENIDKSTEILYSEVIENFFSIRILKEFIHNNVFEKYYNTFISEGKLSEGVFDPKKVEKLLKEIYTFISTSNVTAVRPNNVSELSEEKIEHILEHSDNYDFGDSFSETLAIQLSSSKISIVKEGLINYTNAREDKIDKVKKGLIDELNGLYINGVYNENVTETIDEIVKKTIEIIKNNS